MGQICAVYNPLSPFNATYHLQELFSETNTKPQISRNIYIPETNYLDSIWQLKQNWKEKNCSQKILNCGVHNLKWVKKTNLELKHWWKTNLESRSTFRRIHDTPASHECKEEQSSKNNYGWRNFHKANQVLDPIWRLLYFIFQLAFQVDFCFLPIYKTLYQ